VGSGGAGLADGPARLCRGRLTFSFPDRVARAILNGLDREHVFPERVDDHVSECIDLPLRPGHAPPGTRGRGSRPQARAGRVGRADAPRIRHRATVGLRPPSGGCPSRSASRVYPRRACARGGIPPPRRASEWRRVGRSGCLPNVSGEARSHVHLPRRASRRSRRETDVPAPGNRVLPGGGGRRGREPCSRSEPSASRAVCGHPRRQERSVVPEAQSRCPRSHRRISMTNVESGLLSRVSWTAPARLSR
jgi:hypothetical protein